MVVLVASINDYQKEKQFRDLNAKKDDVQITVVRGGQTETVSTHDLVVGDMDSVAPTALDQARREGATLEQHEVAKDRSDLELAFDAARRFGAASVHVVVRGGGRLDHQLANLLVLTAPELSSVSISASVGHHRVWVVRGRRALDLPVGAHLGLQPVGGPARLTTAGLAYPMTDGTLSPFAAHGIANEVVATPAVVEVDEGVVLAVSSPTIAG